MRNAVLLGGALVLTICSGCMTLYEFNTIFPPVDEIWQHPAASKSENVAWSRGCYSLSMEKAAGIKNYLDLSKEEQDKIWKNLTAHQKKEREIVMENCRLERGYKFYPRGTSGKFHTVCFGEYAIYSPGCRSVREKW
jgi:hypothetical protein